jgi:antitoxin (DNA-binding transcriptional repressor) of toxin-antitoxin stability system
MSEISLDDASGDMTAAAHDAARGQVVYLTEHGQRLAAIVPAELAAELENLSRSSSAISWRTSPTRKPPGKPWRN